MTDRPGWTEPGAPDRPPAGPGGSGPGGWGAPGGGSGPGGWDAPTGWAGPPASPRAARPGIIPLRPLGVGELLDGAISALRAHPRPMIGLSAAVAAVTQLVEVPLSWWFLRDVSSAFDVSAPPPTADEQLASLSGLLTALAVTLPVTLLASLVLTGILTVVVSRAVLGQRIATAQAWAMARPRLPALVGVTLVIGLALVGLVGLSLAPAALLALAEAPAQVVVPVGLGGALVGGLAAVYLYVAWALAPPATVLERASVRTALRRSRGLVRGAWWRTFGLLLLVTIIVIVISQILAVPFSVLALVVSLLSGDGLAVTGFWPLVISGLGAVVAAAVTWPFNAAAVVLLYVDRRMRREGLDLELARAAAGAPAGPPAGPSATSR